MDVIIDFGHPFSGSLTPYDIDKSSQTVANTNEAVLSKFADECGKSIQLFAAGKFIVGSALDLAGTALLVNQIHEGAILVIVGGGINFWATYQFTLGHSQRNGSGECCPANKKEFIRFLQNSCAYSTGFASMAEMIGQLAALQPGSVKVGRVLLLGAGTLSGVALACAGAEMVAESSLCVKQDEANIGDNSAPNKETASGISWYNVCKGIRYLGVLILSGVGVGDPIASTYVDFAPNSTANFTSPESDAGKWAISGLSITGLVGLTLIGAGGIGEWYLAPKKQ